MSNKLIMKFVYIQRKTKTEKRYTQKMGMFTTNVVYVKKYLLGLPLKTVHKYRETYYGKVKDCNACTLSV